MNKLRLVFFTFPFLISSFFVKAQNESSSTSKAEQTEEDKRFQEVVFTDSVPATALAKRGVNWVKADSKRFKKSSGVATGTKAECLATFKIKAKELNPQPDFTGTITMHVSIECKDNKYRYSITKIKHISANGKASGGDINNIIPDCGSMTMPDLVWKKIKGEAFKSASMVISELKEGMSKTTLDSKDEW
jgi:hypothetical protein